MAMADNRDIGRDSNPDPITGAPGSHPIGTGVGAAGGGTAGALIGSAAGPVGTAIGAVVGAVAGGLAGKGVGEMIDPTAEDAYWRENYKTRPYASGSTYDEYAPAYRMGWESSQRFKGHTFEQAEPNLKSDWERAKGKSKLSWDKAKFAVRDAWDRTFHRSHATTGDGSAHSAAIAQQALERGGEARVPVVEEELKVGKREVERGGVRVQTNVEEKPVEQQVNLREEHVRVERRPVDRPATQADVNHALHGRTVEVREHAEQPVVQKEARVVEEVVVGKEATQRTETVRDTVRRTDVDVENVDTNKTNPSAGNPGSAKGRSDRPA
jgi:uncharacterized protein (TIGR02271 family)